MGELTSAVLGGEAGCGSAGGGWKPSPVNCRCDRSGHGGGGGPGSEGRRKLRRSGDRRGLFGLFPAGPGARERSGRRCRAGAGGDPKSSAGNFPDPDPGAGKPLAESLEEADGAPDFVDWYAEEAKRICGEALPGSRGNQRILAIREPVGGRPDDSLESFRHDGDV